MSRTLLALEWPAPSPWGGGGCWQGISGIGKYVALDLARRNARTILACRSRERGQAVVEEIQRVTGNPHVPLRIVDMSNMASIRRFARQIRQEETRLDILVNNAGGTGWWCQPPSPVPPRLPGPGLQTPLPCATTSARPLPA
uniref:Uncharacterized protein n=1 Tax=Chelydra serpentina TaxID=8475 RepID=A0A8C3SEX3_CHESE